MKLKFDVTGMQSAKETKESVKTAQNYFRANAKQISASISLDSRNYLMHIQDCQGVGLDGNISLAVSVLTVPSKRLLPVFRISSRTMSFSL